MKEGSSQGTMEVFIDDKNRTTPTELSDCTYEGAKNFLFISQNDAIVVVFLALVWTALRWFCTRQILKPLAMKLGVFRMNHWKFTESGWKLVFYTSTWVYCLYTIVLSGKYNFFYHPSSVWQSKQMQWDIYILYCVQFSFYFHSVFATLFMDTWRKDSWLMMFHHFVTIALIAFSFAARYHNVGCLVLLCHDVTDVALEFTKLCVYLKQTKSGYHAPFEWLSNIGFVCFAIGWFVFRLYWFPLKVLFVVSRDSTLPEAARLPFALVFINLLWILMLMNIYWFTFILVFIWKAVTGQIDALEDLREYEAYEAEMDEEDRIAELKKSESNNVSNGAATNGHIKENHTEGMRHRTAGGMENNHNINTLYQTIRHDEDKEKGKKNESSKTE